MRFHWLRLRATAHATEDPDRVRQALQFVSGLEGGAFDEATDVEAMTSQYGGPVHAFSANISRSADVRRGVARLLEAVDVADELDARTDQDGVFYLRFDKQAAFLGRLEPTQGDDAVQVRIRPEVHPASRQGAIDALQAILDGEPI